VSFFQIEVEKCGIANNKARRCNGKNTALQCSSKPTSKSLLYFFL
jgi:hypothetical protein